MTTLEAIVGKKVPEEHHLQMPQPKPTKVTSTSVRILMWATGMSWERIILPCAWKEKMWINTRSPYPQVAYHKLSYLFPWVRIIGLGPWGWVELSPQGQRVDTPFHTSPALGEMPAHQLNVLPCMGNGMASLVPDSWGLNPSSWVASSMAVGRLQTSLYFSLLFYTMTVVRIIS